MDLIQRRKQLRLRQIEKVKKFRDSNQSSSDAKSDAIEKQKDREQMKKEIKKELSQESINIENSDGTTFARVMNIIGPTHMRPVVSGGLWKGTEQITEKKSDCECDDCGQDPCIECGESHHSVKESIASNYGSQTAREGDNEAAAAARKRIYDRASAKDKDYMDAREIANQRNKERDKKRLITKEAKEEQGRSDYGKASVRNKRKFGREGKPAVFDLPFSGGQSDRGKMIDSRRAEHKAKRGVKTKGVKEDYYSGTGEKVVARTKKWMKKKGQEGAPGLDAMKARAAEHKAKRGVKEEVVDETYFDTNRRGISTKGGFVKQYNKPGKLSRASLNHERKSKNPELRMSKKELRKSMEDDANYEKKMGRSKPTPSNLKTALKKMKKEEVELDELNRYGKETGKATGSINKRAGTPVKKGGNTSDKALLAVRGMIRRETGKPEGQRKKVKGEKGRVQYGDRRGTPADTIAKRRQASKDAEKLMRDTRGT